MTHKELDSLRIGDRVVVLDYDGQVEGEVARSACLHDPSPRHSIPDEEACVIHSFDGEPYVSVAFPWAARPTWVDAGMLVRAPVVPDVDDAAPTEDRPQDAPGGLASVRDEPAQTPPIQVTGRRKRHGKRAAQPWARGWLWRFAVGVGVLFANTRERLLNRTRVVVRPDPQDGTFDEVMVYDGWGNPIVHFEVLAENVLWVGLHAAKGERHSIDIVAERGGRGEGRGVRLAYLHDMVGDERARARDERVRMNAPSA